MADRETRVYTARGPVDGEDWQAVAAALNERMAALRIGQQELAQRSGVSVSTLRQVQHGAGRRVQNKTLAAISRSLDWPEDHLTAVLLRAGQQPAAVEPGGEDRVMSALHAIEQRLREVSDRLVELERAVTSRGTPDGRSVAE